MNNRVKRDFVLTVLAAVIVVLPQSAFAQAARSTLARVPQSTFAQQMSAGVAKGVITNSEPRVMVNGRVSEGRPTPRSRSALHEQPDRLVPSITRRHIVLDGT